jgi:RNA polymerase sigma-70 factor (ECF subfamily)
MKHQSTAWSSLADAELFAALRGTRQESEGAFTEIYARYATQVHTYCLHILSHRSAAEDVFQETFVRFYNSATAERGDCPPTNVIGFLITIARNLCLNHKSSRREYVSLEEYTIVEPAPLQAYESSELMSLIERSLDLLEPHHREAFVLREFDGLPYAEIAEILKTTEATAKTWAFRAKQKIQQILQPYLHDLNRNA